MSIAFVQRGGYNGVSEESQFRKSEKESPGGGGT